MNSEDTLYRDLQIHLDRQTIGFPKTASGSDIALLKELFEPRHAEIAMLLTYKYESLAQIQDRSAGRQEEIERLLDEVAAKGLIAHREQDGVKQYKNLPYIVGMIEAAAQNPNPELMSAHVRYMQDGLFPRAFMNTRIPQMRTIPVAKSLTPRHEVGNYDQIREIIKSMDGPIMVFDCVCRKGAENAGQPCKRTSRKETCMALGEVARSVAASGRIGRQIGKEEALAILQQNQDEALVLQPSNSQAPDFICSCCGCCCGLLKLHKMFPDPVSHWATNFFAQVSPELCTGCASCLDRCQAGALSMNAGQSTPAVDLARCLGCGLCVVGCPENAIVLQKKAAETIPPCTGEDMMEYIMTHKGNRQPPQ